MTSMALQMTQPVKRAEKSHFTQTPNIISEIGLTATQKAVYGALKIYAGEFRTCTASLNTLARKAEISKSSLQRALKFLAQPILSLGKPLINILKRTKKNHSNETNEIILIDLWNDNSDFFEKRKNRIVSIHSHEKIPDISKLSPQHSKIISFIKEESQMQSKEKNFIVPLKEFQKKEDSQFKSLGNLLKIPNQRSQTNDKNPPSSCGNLPSKSQDFQSNNQVSVSQKEGGGYGQIDYTPMVKLTTPTTPTSVISTVKEGGGAMVKLTTKQDSYIYNNIQQQDMSDHENPWSQKLNIPKPVVVVFSCLEKIKDPSVTYEAKVSISSKYRDNEQVVIDAVECVLDPKFMPQDSLIKSLWAACKYQWKPKNSSNAIEINRKTSEDLIKRYQGPYHLTLLSKCLEICKGTFSSDVISLDTNPEVFKKRITDLYSHRKQ